MTIEAIKKYIAGVRHVLIAAPFLLALLGVLHFPYDVDALLTQQEIAAAQKYYADAYQAPVREGATTEYETKYLRLAEEAAKALRIEEQVAEFAREFNLSKRAVLEIGSGRGTCRM